MPPTVALAEKRGDAWEERVKTHPDAVNDEAQGHHVSPGDVP